MYYFFKWMAKKWMGNFKKIHEYNPISKMVNGYLDLWDGYETIFWFALFQFIIYVIASLVMLITGVDWTIPLFMFGAHMVLVFLALQYREYQEEKTKILNKLKD